MATFIINARTWPRFELLGSVWYHRRSCSNTSWHYFFVSKVYYTLFSIPTMPATFPSTRLTATSPPNPLFPAKKSKSKKKKRPTEEERFAIGQAKRLLKRGKRSQKWEIRYQLVLSAVRSTIAILQNFGLSCAAFGSLACKLYGEFRFPEDVNLLVLQPPQQGDLNSSILSHTVEEIKKLIIDADPVHYYFKTSGDLFYREEGYRTDCRVDIVLPGTMHLPNLLPPEPSGGATTANADTGDGAASATGRQIITISGIPVIPFCLLLLHKLQAWSDRYSSNELSKRRKSSQDKVDVKRLLNMWEHIEPLRLTQPWTNKVLFSEEFQELTKERVKKYCSAFRKKAVCETWKSLGFEVDDFRI